MKSSQSQSPPLSVMKFWMVLTTYWRHSSRLMRAICPQDTIAGDESIDLTVSGETSLCLPESRGHWFVFVANAGSDYDNWLVATE